MNLMPVIFMFALGNVWVTAQSDSSISKKKNQTGDTTKATIQIQRKLPRSDFVIQKKDLKLIKPVEGMNFVVDGDEMKFTSEEIESGLTIEELKAIRANKDSLLSYITPEPGIDEKKEYPVLYQLRKILGTAKTIGVIIILLLSIL
jgi:hypothetical protein